jgi:hypothetical protein
MKMPPFSRTAAATFAKYAPNTILRCRASLRGSSPSLVGARGNPRWQYPALPLASGGCLPRRRCSPLRGRDNHDRQDALPRHRPPSPRRPPRPRRRRAPGSARLARARGRTSGRTRSRGWPKNWVPVPSRSAPRDLVIPRSARGLYNYCAILYNIGRIGHECMGGRGRPPADAGGRRVAGGAERCAPWEKGQ